ncbi:hypothetical protein [Hymenobacter latericus]|uniref:hypothetical protein n=1 Tax=Hymenobacter sp. YIM 151858-1 TaxID=2987688 RepID=UPI002225D5FB|nr:hypothetical protein [Hymenobacter sp. YIM 151858-1]UYZ59576.1 hypothetical protein OIS50_01980 [Hymenobacter sp. YIM 151858-1]
MKLACALGIGCWLWLGSAQVATAQVRTPRKAAPPAAARSNMPSVWRNQPAPEARQQLPLSRQDKQAYENCPDPKRYARKHRRRMVRIW